MRKLKRRIKQLLLVYRVQRLWTKTFLPMSLAIMVVGVEGVSTSKQGKLVVGWFFRNKTRLIRLAKRCPPFKPSIYDKTWGF